MKKTLAILLTLIILITSVSYDSYAADNPIDYNNYVYQLTTNTNNTYYFESSVELFLELDANGQPYQFWVPPYSTALIALYTTNFTNSDMTYSVQNNNPSYGLFHGLVISPSWGGIINEIHYSNTSIRLKDTQEIYTLPPSYIPTPDEYLYITTPREGFKTIDKFMTYNVMYSIAAENINDVTLKINDENNVPFTEAPLIESFDALNHTATLENGYLKGQVQIWADYLDTYTGPLGVNISVLNTATNRELKVARNIEIYDFIDENGDGIDDNTGEDYYNRDESIVVTTPLFGSKTVNRLVPMNFYIRIKSDDYYEVVDNTQILYFDSTTSTWNNLLTSDIMNNWNSNINNRNQLRLWNFHKDGDYVVLNMTVNLLFADQFLGNVPIRIKTTSSNGTEISTNHRFEIVAFMDSNNDGIDDLTGEVYNPDPTLPNYDDSEASLNDAIGNLQNVLPALQNALTTIVSLLGLLFGWLPVEIRFLMVTVMTLIGITTIVKVLRG